jgi:hypothetical protein
MTTSLQNNLVSGEKILWSGQPIQGLTLTSRDVFLIPFSILWGSFAIFWELMVLHAPRVPFIMRLWGIPFVLVGLYLMVGRFFFDAWLRQGMEYAVTNKRVLIYRAPPFSRFIALKLDNLPQTELIQRNDGRGTIRFGQYFGLWGRGGWYGYTPALDQVPQFIGIENAQKVFQLIQDAPGK